eukprot:gene7435-9137_t
MSQKQQQQQQDETMSSSGGASNSSYYQQYMSRFDLPTHWNSKDKCNHLEITASGLRVSYKSGKADNDAALVRANNPIPSACGIFYFEITVISKGREGYIGVGVCTSAMPLTRLPGWEKNSYGYHGDDGNIFKGSGSGRTYGPTYTTGDVVGCCINFVQNTLFFTKNGVPLGEAANDIKGLNLYPCIGLRTPGESIEVNFGQRPFTFDIEQLFKEEKHRVFKSMKATSTGEEEITATQLVLAYLMHHGYSETVRLFANATGIADDSLNSQLDDIKNRQRISELLSKGEIDKVISELNRLYPDFLQKRKDILFKLLCQKFIEMIKSSPIEETMAFGQKELYKFSQESAEYENNLKEVFSLIAYTNPFSSPVSYLLQEDRREPIVSDLNCALLATPVLEKIVRQTKVVIDEVVNNSAGPSAIFINVKEFIENDDT